MTALGRYAKYFEEAEVSGDSEDQSESEFAHAFSEEIGCSLEDLASFLSAVQNILLEMDQPYWNCCPDKLKRALFSKAPELEGHFDVVLNALTMPIRENWNEIPEGFFGEGQTAMAFQAYVKYLAAANTFLS